MRFKIPGKREDNMKPMRTLLLFIGLGLLASVSAAHAQQTPQPPAQSAAQPAAQPAAMTVRFDRANNEPIFLASIAGHIRCYNFHVIDPVADNVAAEIRVNKVTP